MAELPPDGTPLLGVPRRSSAPLNSFALWQYLLIFAVVLIGLTYAAPNVFQPDPAIQIRALDQRGEQGTANDAANQAVSRRHGSTAHVLVPLQLALLPVDLTHIGARGMDAGVITCTHGATRSGRDEGCWSSGEGGSDRPHTV